MGETQSGEKIVIASDHAGFRLKEHLKKMLKKLGFNVLDEGCTSPEKCDYPDHIGRAAERISRGDVKRGIAICGTGVGASIVANKYPNVRAALAYKPAVARLSREHNDANMLVLSGWFLPFFLARRILKIWLTTPFSNGPSHVRRIAKIRLLEGKILGILLILLLAAPAVFSAEFVWQGRSLDELVRQGTVFVGSSNSGKITLAYNRPDAASQGVDLLLNFNEPQPRTDATGRYPVKEYDVVQDADAQFQDTLTGGFVTPANRVILAVPDGSLFAEQTDLQSFSIAFWLKPSESAGQQIILERRNTIKGRPYGLMISTAGRRIIFNFDNMFYDNRNKPRSIAIQSSPVLSGRHWVHVACVYDNVSGKLLLTLDGREETVLWATESGNPDRALLVPRFTGRSELILGRDPFGAMDDLLVTRSRDLPGTLHSTVHASDRGEVLTDVLENRFFNSEIRSVLVNRRTNRTGTGVLIRTSDQPFAADAQKPDWSVFAGASRGKYFQVKLVLSGDEGLRAGSEVRSLEITTFDMPDLEPPLFVALSVTNTFLRVTWRPSDDRRIRGYFVILRDGAGNERRIDTGPVSDGFLVDGLKDRENYTVTVSSYDDAIPANESRPSKSRKIFFTYRSSEHE